MNEQMQRYKEITKAVRESGIPLDLQKELQRLLDKEYVNETEQNGEDKTMKDFKPGNTVEFAGQKWNVLEEIGENKFLCMSNDIIFKKKFDKGNSNNWKESSLRRYLNGEYLERFKDVNLATWQQDLTTDDGLEDYGNSEDKIFLLTEEQYRKYRKHIRDVKDWWWLITADSTVNNLVRSVYPDGSLSYGNAYGACYGVRPACVVVLSI